MRCACRLPFFAGHDAIAIRIRTIKAFKRHRAELFAGDQAIAICIRVGTIGATLGPGLFPFRFGDLTIAIGVEAIETSKGALGHFLAGDYTVAIRIHALHAIAMPTTASMTTASLGPARAYLLAGRRALIGIDGAITICVCTGEALIKLRIHFVASEVTIAICVAAHAARLRNCDPSDRQDRTS